MKNTAVMILRIHYKDENDAESREEDIDIEVPLHITANDLVTALNHGFQLGMDADNAPDAYLRTENPVTLVKGGKTVAEFGLYDGTVIHVTKRGGSSGENV
jgi:hypothetical protein